MRNSAKPFLLLLLLLVCTCAFAQSPPDAATLFRDEVVTAERKLRWSGPDLSDETLLAVAFSGLSWDPASGGIALFKRAKNEISYADASSRLKGFEEAKAAGRHKIAAPFALSLVLDPGRLEHSAWQTAFEYLDQYDTDFDGALVGILQAPDKLPLLPDYLYSAMDSLVLRSSPRLIPLFITLAGSEDAYLRSRAVAGIGIAAYEARPGVEPAYPGLPLTLKESSISAAQRRLIAEIMQRAAEDASYRVRAAAALALGLAGDESDLPLLEKLAKDRAYILLATHTKGERRVVVPVRAQAALSLARYGKRIASGEEVLSGEALKKTLRGGRDVTRDQSGIRRHLLGPVSFHQGLW